MSTYSIERDLVPGPFRVHIETSKLTSSRSVRLFTCQRARKVTGWRLQTSVKTFVLSVVNPAGLGRGRRNTIVAIRSVNGCREDFSRSKPKQRNRLLFAFDCHSVANATGSQYRARRSSSTAADTSRRFESDPSGPISDGRIMLPESQSVKRHQLSRLHRLETLVAPP